MPTSPTRHPSLRRPRILISPQIALAALALGASPLLWQQPIHGADITASAEVGSNNDYRLFYDKLGNDGDWFKTDQYGYVFQPHAAGDKAWRPYTDGYWAQTSAGWTWVSNENHGWATYHYGRWANVVDTGWVWVPGADWSPGYVSWRVSKDHKRVGWAPLPPEAVVSRDQGIEGWVDTAYDIGPDAYVFIDTNHFGETSYRANLIPEEQNVTIIAETDNVTRCSYRDVNNVSIVYNGGPDVSVIREVTGQPVREFQLDVQPQQVDYFQREDFHKYNAVNGNQIVVALAAPEVIRSTSIQVSQPARISRSLTSVSVDRGYRGIGDPQKIDNIRKTLRSQSPPPPPRVEQAASAAIHRGESGSVAPTAQGGPKAAAKPTASSSQPSPVPPANTLPPAPVRKPPGSPSPTPKEAQLPRPSPAVSPAALATPADRSNTAAAPSPSLAKEEAGQHASPSPEKAAPAKSLEGRHASAPENATPAPKAKESRQNAPETPASTPKTAADSSRPEPRAEKPVATARPEAQPSHHGQPGSNEAHKSEPSAEHAAAERKPAAPAAAEQHQDRVKSPAKPETEKATPKPE